MPQFNQVTGENSLVEARCDLIAGDDHDIAPDDLFMAAYTEPNLRHLTATMPLQLVHTQAAAGDAHLDCNSNSTGLRYNQMVITAIKLGQVVP
jgi:hypothetical protein